MGQNGKQYIHDHYRWSTILTKYERLFSRLRSQPRDDGRDRASHPGRERDRDRSRSPDRNRAANDSRPRGGDRNDRQRRRYRPN